MSDLLSPPSRTSWLSAILILYLILGGIYAWATPPLESSDEYKHYPVVQHIQTTGRLVVLDPANEGKWKQAGAQPPLYYLLMAGLTWPIDTSDLDALHVENPHAFIGNAAHFKNKNLILHEPGETAFPWRGSILAIMLIRFASIGLGVGTLLLTYQLGVRLFSERIGLFAAALTAFNPMFLFISAAVNNDSLAALIGSWGLLLLVKLWQETTDPRRGWRLYLWLGLACGLGLLTKLSLGGLLLLAGVVTGLRSWQKRNPAILFGGGVAILVLSLLLVAPWIWRNWQLYGDLTGLNVFVAVQGTRDNPSLWGVDWVAEFGTFYRTFWGLFGAVNVLAPDRFYQVANGLVLAGLLGWGLQGLIFLRQLRRRELLTPHHSQGVWIALAFAAVLFVLLIRWNIISPAFQGRLMFPGLSGLNVIWAAGLNYLLLFAGTQMRLPEPKLGIIGVGLFFGVMAAIIPFTHIAPVYAFPEPTAVPPAATFGPITYTNSRGEELRLVGVELADEQIVTPGSQPGVEVVLYWQLPQPTEANWVTAVHLLGRDLSSVGQVDRYPGWGMWPTSRWEAGAIYADRYRIFPRSDAQAPSLLRLDVSVTNTETGETLSPTSPNGGELPLVLVGEAVLRDPDLHPLTPSRPLRVDFADFASFLGYDVSSRGNQAVERADRLSAVAGLPLTFDLYWQANGRPSREYTVFLQLIDSSGQYAAGADAPPLDGDYPTPLWRAGDQLVDRKVLFLPPDLPAGSYTIIIGLYDRTDNYRMPRVDGGGDRIEIPIEITN